MALTAHAGLVEPVATACSTPRTPPGGRLASARARGQSVVEFGLVVMLFVVLMSGIFDFGVLLNARLSVSSLSRVLARARAANATPGELTALANQQGHILGVTTDGFVGYCCAPGNAIVVKYTYCDQANTSGCTPPAGTPQPGDRIVVSVNAVGVEVFTALTRPFFGCSGSQRHCFVPMTAQTTMRLERTYP